MHTYRLIKLSLKYQWEAHKSNRANLIAGAVGTIINNVIVLWGLWVMLFDGKPDSEILTLYFLSLNAMVTIAWGANGFFMGGFRYLGEYIEEGSLEPMLSTPRHPLLLVGVSQSSTPALGDLLQGFINLIALSFLAPPDMVLRCVVFTIVSAIAFLGMFIIIGSIPFFISRGSALSQLLIECNLSLAFYPSGKVFSGVGLALLFLTPAAFAGILPMQAVETGDAVVALFAFTGALTLFFISVQVFNLGLKRYQSTHYISLRS